MYESSFKYDPLKERALSFAHHDPISFSQMEIFMTPQDFLRSITPGIMQPQGYGLDHYKKIDAKVGGLCLHHARKNCPN